MGFESINPEKKKIDVSMISPGQQGQTYDEFCKILLQKIAKSFNIPEKLLYGRREKRDS